MLRFKKAISYQLPEKKFIKWLLMTKEISFKWPGPARKRSLLIADNSYITGNLTIDYECF